MPLTPALCHPGGRVKAGGPLTRTPQLPRCSGRALGGETAVELHMQVAESRLSYIIGQEYDPIHTNLTVTTPYRLKITQELYYTYPDNIIKVVYITQFPKQNITIPANCH